jgi:DNA-binding transcriptional ArsR family regulator
MARGRCLNASARIFRALGHPTRLGIVEMLAEGERCVCEIVPSFGDSQATISRHLDILLRAGIVSRRRDGVRMLYRLEMPCLIRTMPCVERAVRGDAGSEAACRRCEAVGERSGAIQKT